MLYSWGVYCNFNPISLLCIDCSSHHYSAKSILSHRFSRDDNSIITARRVFIFSLGYLTAYSETSFENFSPFQSGVLWNKENGLHASIISNAVISVCRLLLWQVSTWCGSLLSTRAFKSFCTSHSIPKLFFCACSAPCRPPIVSLDC